jgi:BirA family biotin operon repressor/biotin-[acetyl-CoA-carboxylase] ligase
MSRGKVLHLLKSRPGSFFSGEEIAAALGLTRAAVWKAADALRRDGYTIEARTNLGYRLVTAPDALSEEEIREHLDGIQVVGKKLICLDTVDSTNTYLRKLALAGEEEGTVVTADEQTGGRGRRNRHFASPRGKMVLFSAFLRPRRPPAELTGITAQTAVALCGGIEEACGVRPQIKWTNDLILGGKKICGILTEMAIEGETGQIEYLVVGAGINVRQTKEDFGLELSEIAGSLDMLLDTPVSRPKLAACCIRALDRLCADVRRGEFETYWQSYRRDCVTIGQKVQLVSSDGTRENALALDIDRDYSLLVEMEDGTHRTVRTGEVSVRGMYGYV